MTNLMEALFPNLLVTAGVFLLVALVIIGCAVLLANACDVIAVRSGWGRLWVGTLLLAGASSLPELVASVTAVRIGAPELAVGNIFGANMLNVSNLAIVVALIGGRGVYQRISPHQGHLLGLALAMTGVAAFFAAVQFNVRFAYVSPAGLVLLGVYIVGSHYLYKVSSGARAQAPEAEEESSTGRSLGWGIGAFLAAAAGIFLAAPLLAASADRIAGFTGLSSGFMGVLFVAIVTTLPELTATITAMRLGAYDLAVSGMYGTNAFNVAALGVADFFSKEGSLFGNLGQSELLAGVIAVVLMAMALVQLRQRRPVAHIGLLRPNTSSVVGLYLIGLYGVYMLGR
ncbi:MAG: hypothetical protein HY532_02950 [Chloroflexi bacterium]|nr:hypothetical protein [Chloroflexota bacterium]